MNLTKKEERDKYDYIRNIYSASTRVDNDMGIKTRQAKALEIRDLLKQVNARVAELEEEGYTVEFKGRMRKFNGFIQDVIISKTTVL